nr:hypothetical protein [uncultured Carboxylicivirga sp.]
MSKLVKLYLSIFAVLAMISCNVEDAIDQINSVDDGVEALQEYAIVNKQFQDACNYSDQAIIDAELELIGELKSSNSGPVITIEPFDATTWPKNITVDFCDGITGKDGIIRSGKLLIESTGWYRTEGSVHTTSFDNFYQNGYKIEGTHVATNNGNVSDEGLQFNVTITGGKISKGDAVINFKQNSTRTWVAGSDTPLNIWDDEYTLDGTQTGVSSKGVTYAMSITESLHFVVLTKEVTKGKVAVVIEGLPNIEMDYNTSTIKIGEISYPMKN